MRNVVFKVAILSIVAKIFGFARDLVFLYFYGANALTDTYKLAMTLPLLIVITISAAINTALIPVLNDAQKKKNQQEFFSKFLTTLFIVVIVIMVLIILFARPLSYVVSIQLKESVRIELIKYMRLFSALILLQSLTYSFIGYLQKEGRFYYATLVSLPLNVVMILGIYFFHRPTLFSISVITVFAYLIQTIFIAIPVFRQDYRYKPSFSLKDEHIRMFFLLIGPIILSYAAEQLNVLVDKNIASGLAAGTITIIDLSERIKVLFYSLFVLSISNIIFSNQSKIAMENGEVELFQYTKSALSQILMFVVPISGGIIVLNQEIVRFLYLRGEFSADKAYIVGILLMIASISIVSGTIIHFLSNMMFALKLPKVAMVTTYTMIPINIVLSLILSRYFDVYGLMFATTLSNVLAAVYFIIIIKNRFRKFNPHFISKSFVKYIMSTLVMILFIMVFKLYVFKFNDLITMILSMILGAIVYGASLYALKTEEIVEVYHVAKNAVIEKLS